MAQFNGRSSSQPSVYNYPEHLNPFYEDEQHKRLRFWKIGSSKNGNSRRGSFNLGSFKDFLPLKTFRLRKRSSALGVNKTSESPPPLRKQIDHYNAEDGDKYATYDPHFRHTVSVGLNSGFQRNAPYRNSLQDMNRNANTLDFIRNNRYRSTIQNGTNQISPLRGNNGRYMYAGSVTPTPRSRYMDQGMTPGSSMNSISTNPFDDDDENADTLTIASTASKSGHNRIRKKRRAPAPPTISKPFSEAEAAITLRIEENNGVNSVETAELSRLTADFETFLKHSQDDIDQKPVITTETVEIHHHTEVKSNDSEPDTNENQSNSLCEAQPPVVAFKEEKDEHKDLNIVELTNEISPVVQNIQQTTTEVNQYHEVQKTTKTPSREDTPDFIPMTVREKFHVLRIEETEMETKSIKNDATPNGFHEKSQSPERKFVGAENPSQPEIKIVEAPLKNEEIKITTENFEKVPSPTASEETQVIKVEVNKESTLPKSEPTIMVENDATTKNLSSLYIKDPSPPIRKREETPIPIAKTEIETKLSSQGFIKVDKPLKYHSYELEEKFIREMASDDSNAPPKPPERRRSVKDIIESINRNQALLKINQPPTPQFERKFYYEGQKFSYHEKPAPPPKENVLRKLQLGAESEKRINELLADLEDFRNKNPPTIQAHKFPSNLDDDDDEDYTSKPVMFNKCTVQRSDKNNNCNKASERLSRGDINPVPKPRRFFDN